MTDILTPGEKELASQYGWDLGWVFDTASKRVTVRIFPTERNTVKSSDLLHRAAAARAASGDAFAKRVIHIITQSNK